MKYRVQSAMEYLMTYGWAILAIAIVMVLLYSIGIFNLVNLQPTATPGSCQVIRTLAGTSLAGQCNNLIPKYVAKFGSDNGLLLVSSSVILTRNRTMLLWAYISGTYSPSGNPLIGPTIGVCNNGYLFKVQSNSPYQMLLDDCGAGGVWPQSSASVSSNKWNQIGYTYNGIDVVFYVNGKQVGIVAQNALPNLGLNGLAIGSESGFCCTYNYFNGSMSNIQMYNISIDNNTIKALYQEGIAGVPIDLQHLVAWWPLNGDANDYSGNNNQGIPTNVIWNANWQYGYIAS
ncbi:MAG: LamG domain-containing protein [Candidatus Micrarchaeota archaeon]|nr:LamG domain-containing protein [Candidatus Micrarchaeota archaeon]